MHTHRAAEFDKESGGLEFDKDDPQALDFVTSASNLRSEVFHIARKSRWEVKEIAGKIVPAIATTNAIIGGFIVLEALKVRACVVCAWVRASCTHCTCAQPQIQYMHYTHTSAMPMTGAARRDRPVQIHGV
jgi:hypothetical protein